LSLSAELPEAFLAIPVTAADVSVQRASVVFVRLPFLSLATGRSPAFAVGLPLSRLILTHIYPCMVLTTPTARFIPRAKPQAGLKRTVGAKNGPQKNVGKNQLSRRGSRTGKLNSGVRKGTLWLKKCHFLRVQIFALYIFFIPCILALDCPAWFLDGGYLPRGSRAQVDLEGILQ
jgi:hypothetical protein